MTFPATAAQWDANNDLPGSSTGPTFGLFSPPTLIPELRGENEAAALTSGQAIATARIVRPVVIPRLPSESRLGVFLALQRWEGVVLDVGQETFTARLADRTSPSREEEEVEIPLDEVSRSDLNLLSPGAIFYWSIGYLDRPSGQRLRESVIRFRRLPAWSRHELDVARRRAKELRDFLVERK